KVMRDRTTASCHRLASLQSPLHLRHQRSVADTCRIGSIRLGLGSCDGFQLKTKLVRCPADRVNSPATFEPRREHCTSPLRKSASGPAIITTAPSIVRIQGIVLP